MFSAVWKMLKDTVLAFINDEALSRGAAIAFYTVTSIAPVLLIVIAIAGLAFGRDAAQNAITEQLSGLMGRQTAEVLQTAVASASSKSSTVLATMVGIITLIVTASGVFGEMQTALNAIWKAEPKGTTVSQLIRARAVSLGLVAALGFLLMVSLVVSTALTAFGNYLDSILPFGNIILTALNGVVSLMLISFLFAAISCSRRGRIGMRGSPPRQSAYHESCNKLAIKFPKCVVCKKADANRCSRLGLDLSLVQGIWNPTASSPPKPTKMIEEHPRR